MSSNSSNKSSESSPQIPRKINRKKHSHQPSSQEDHPTIKNNKRRHPPTYLVEDILAKEKIQGKWKFLVKWKGFPKEEATWEPIKNLETVKVMVKNFELKQKLKSNKEKNRNKLKEITEEAEKLKAHKKSDNSFFNNIDVGSNNVSENENNMMGNSQMLFKNNPNLVVDTEREGDFRLGDKPKNIVFAKKTKNGILFAVEWETRKNGINPEISFYDNSQMKNYAPQILIDFYEGHLKVKDESNANGVPFIIEKK